MAEGCSHTARVVVLCVPRSLCISHPDLCRCGDDVPGLGVASVADVVGAMTTPLADQIACLEFLRDGGHGNASELNDAIKTLRLIAEFPDDVREALKRAKARRDAIDVGGEVVERVLEVWPDADVRVT